MQNKTDKVFDFLARNLELLFLLLAIGILALVFFMMYEAQKGIHPPLQVYKIFDKKEVKDAR